MILYVEFEKVSVLVYLCLVVQPISTRVAKVSCHSFLPVSTLCHFVVAEMSGDGRMVVLTISAKHV